MSKVQQKGSTTKWFQDKFCNSNISLNKVKSDKKNVDFKNELAELLAKRRHKELEMRHNFYNVENEIDNDEENEVDSDEELSVNESNKLIGDPCLEKGKENTPPRDEVKEAAFEEERDDDCETDNEREGDEDAEQEENSFASEEDEEENHSLSKSSKFVPHRKIYVVEDDEDLDEGKTSNGNEASFYFLSGVNISIKLLFQNLDNCISIQSKLTTNTIGELFTIEDDEDDNNLDSYGDIAEDYTEKDTFDEEILENSEAEKQQYMREMFDDEASLSGDDIGSDRDDADDLEGIDEYEAEEGDLDKLDDEKIRDNLIRQYNKYERDADDKRLLKLQEAFFADSDLHNFVGGSDKSFRFRMHTDSKIEWSKIFNIDAGEDFNEEEDSESASRREKRLQMLEWQLEQHKKGIKRKASELINSDEEEENCGDDQQQIACIDLGDDSNTGELFHLGEQILFSKKNESHENKLNESSTKDPLHSVQLPSPITSLHKKDSLIDGASNLEILFKNRVSNKKSTTCGSENINSFFRIQNT